MKTSREKTRPTEDVPISVLKLKTSDIFKTFGIRAEIVEKNLEVCVMVLMAIGKIKGMLMIRGLYTNQTNR